MQLFSCHVNEDRWGGRCGAREGRLGLLPPPTGDDRISGGEAGVQVCRPAGRHAGRQAHRVHIRRVEKSLAHTRRVEKVAGGKVGSCHGRRQSVCGNSRGGTADAGGAIINRNRNPSKCDLVSMSIPAKPGKSTLRVSLHQVSVHQWSKRMAIATSPGNTLSMFMESQKRMGKNTNMSFKPTASGLCFITPVDYVSSLFSCLSSLISRLRSKFSKQ